MGIFYLSSQLSTEFWRFIHYNKCSQIPETPSFKPSLARKILESAVPTLVHILPNSNEKKFPMRSASIWMARLSHSSGFLHSLLGISSIKRSVYAYLRLVVWRFQRDTIASSLCVYFKATRSVFFREVGFPQSHQELFSDRVQTYT